MSAVEDITRDSEDTGNSRSGVFRRIMARDLYDVTKRVQELEETTRNPISQFLASWPQIVLVIIFFLLLVGNITYFSHRINNVEAVHREEEIARSAELESKQQMIDELRETIREQANTLRSLAASPALPALPTDQSGPAATSTEETVVAPQRASSEVRTPLPAVLQPGEVLVIVASTLVREEAIERASVLEADGFASEVILGKTGYYGVALGRFDLQQAKSMKSFLIDSGVYKTTPYLINEESIDSFVYP